MNISLFLADQLVHVGRRNQKDEAQAFAAVVFKGLYHWKKQVCST